MVSNGGFHPSPGSPLGTVLQSAGVHDFQVQYFQGRGGSELALTLPAGVSYVNSAAVQTTVLTGLHSVGTGKPYSNPTGTIATSALQFGTDTGLAWNPFGLSSNFGSDSVGYLRAFAAGSYSFYLGSDDGSALFIDGIRIIDNGGFHPYPGLPTGTATLTPGLHQFEVQFFQGGGGNGFNLFTPAVVTMAEAPENATLALTFGGLVLVVLLRRRLVLASRRYSEFAGSPTIGTVHRVVKTLENLSFLIRVRLSHLPCECKLIKPIES